MFTKISSEWLTNGKERIQAVCMEGDPMETINIANGSICLEMDTGKFYGFNESSTPAAWIEIGE